MYCLKTQKYLGTGVELNTYMSDFGYLIFWVGTGLKCN
jgi:hypothetical protein